MKQSMTALMLSLTVTTAAAALAIPAVQAADDGASSKFETFDVTPKAPRKDDVTARQIVVEPKQETPKEPEVAKLDNPVVEEVAPAEKQQAIAADTPEKPAEDKVETTAEAPKQTEEKVAAPKIDEDAFAPKTAEKAKKVEMPTVFTDEQKELFNKLSPEQQATLVEKLVKKYGHETMYPKNVSRDYLKEYKTTPSYQDDHYGDDDSYGYDDGYGNQSSYGYGYYGSSYKTNAYNCQ